MDRIWEILQIEATRDKKEIRRAYARLSKEIHPEEKPEEFQDLYEAYQNALKYASYGERREKRITFETEQKEEDVSVSEERNKYEELGLDFEEVQKDWLKAEKIKNFQNSWRMQIFRWRQGEDFPNENWREYLQSKSFQEIMWSPAVMERIAEGIIKYFQQKEEILRFFCGLYAVEMPEEGNCNAKALQIYGKLHPAYLKSTKREQIQKEWTRAEKIEYFQSCWRKQIYVWGNGGSFLSGDWKEYLQSESFREIMWSPVVLESIAKGMSEYRNKEEMALFFWDLYEFEKLGEENCKGQSLQLFRYLYPAYTNRVKRRQYAESRDERKKEGRKRICRIAAICAGVLVIFLAMLYIDADIALAVAGIIGAPFCIYYFYKWFFGA